MPPQNRPSIDFDPGIGQGAEPTGDAHMSNALAGLQRTQREDYAAATAVPLPPIVVPPQVTAPGPVDVYRERNPSLPTIKFANVEHLPSAGKAYPPGTRISYRPYTLGESVHAEASRLDMRGTYDLILKGVDCGTMDKFKLTLPDVLFLGLVRKIASLGTTKVNLTTTCPFCKGMNRTPVECSALDFEDLQVPELPIVVDFSFGSHEFRPLTLESYLDLLDRSLEEDFVAIMAAQCATNLPLNDRIEMIRSMTDPEDISLVKQIDEMLHHQLKPIPIVCPQETDQLEEDGRVRTCGRRYPVALDDVSAAFVLPFSGRPGERSSGKISFGSSRNKPNRG